MMKNKFTFKGMLATKISAIFIAMIMVFGFATTANAGSDSYSDFGWEDYSYDSYQPSYDYSYDYYQPSYDYSYDYDVPSYDYSYDYNQPTYDYGSYGGYADYGTPSYGSYGGYSTPSYGSYGGYSTPSYSTPSYGSYPTYGGGGSSNVNTSSSNSAAQAVANSVNNINNVNTNNNNNVNNNVNNVNVVVGTPISAVTPSVPQNNLDGNCYISPSTVYINQDVTFNVNATGGNGNYTYSWSGSDGISSSARTFTGRFSSFGSKTATVVIFSGSQSISRSCNVQVQDTYNYNYQNNTMSVYCVASPSVASVGQTVTWSAYATGGNGGYYNYSWSGTDGLSYGNASVIQKSYSTAGTKSAYVTVTGNNGQTISANCSMNVQGVAATGGVTVIRDNNLGAPISGVYLSEVPATGISGSLKVTLFMVGILIWSAALGYFFVSRRKTALVRSTTSVSTADKALAFKQANLNRKTK